MYRYNVDNVVMYTPDDLVLFRESPFAVWMERLTLENPDHGILPDMHDNGPKGTEEPQDSIVETLRAEGRQVALIGRELDEEERRVATLAAMRDGADFIVNGQLAAGVLSGSANLLMRTSGYSELGGFLYIPCDTQAGDRFRLAFRLSFTADLLRSLQGQLPPQMLIIRDGADVVPLQTEDYIYYYQAVQKRFMHAMSTFRKHRMPDPTESAHFGRWSECASEVLKQRARREQYQAKELAAEGEIEEAIEMPQLLVATGSAAPRDSYDTGVASPPGLAEAKADGPVVQGSGATVSIASGHTLAEQARMLDPGSFHPGAAPGRTPNLARLPNAGSAAAEPENQQIEHNRRSSDATLQNLEFIGSNASQTIPVEGSSTFPAKETGSAPGPNLRETPVHSDQAQLQQATESVELSEQEPREPHFLPPDPAPAVESPAARPEPRPRSDSVVDLDSAPAPSPAPDTPEAVTDPCVKPQESGSSQTDAVQIEDKSDEDSPPSHPFNNSLNTSQEFDDG